VASVSGECECECDGGGIKSQNIFKWRTPDNVEVPKGQRCQIILYQKQQKQQKQVPDFAQDELVTIMRSIFKLRFCLRGSSSQMVRALSDLSFLWTGDDTYL